MYITVSELSKYWNIAPTGVLHVGAHLGEEASDYEKFGWAPVIWVEAPSRCFVKDVHDEFLFCRTEFQFVFKNISTLTRGILFARLCFCCLCSPRRLHCFCVFLATDFLIITVMMMVKTLMVIRRVVMMMRIVSWR